MRVRDIIYIMFVRVAGKKIIWAGVKWPTYNRIRCIIMEWTPQVD